MRIRSVAAALVLTQVIAGCAYIGKRDSSPAIPSVVASFASLPSAIPSPDTTATATMRPTPPPTLAPTPTLQPTPTGTPAPTRTLEPTPTPSPVPRASPAFVSGLEASDRFWDRWIETDCFFGVGSLASSIRDMVRDADLIIRGRIVDLYIGEYWRGAADEPAYPLAYAEVSIDELLMGEPVSREAGFIEVQIGHASNDLDELRMRLPGHEHLWFLNYEDRERSPFNRSDIVGFVYYAGQDVEKVFREIDGMLKVFRPERIRQAYGKDEFLLTIDGTDFDRFVQRVRDAVTGQSRAHSYARHSPAKDLPDLRFAAC